MMKKAAHSILTDSLFIILTTMLMLGCSAREESGCSGAFGMANKLLHDSTAADTRYLIGSVTKVFTAVAVLQLHEKGLLDIDEPLTDRMPGFTIRQRFPESAPITVRDVLTYHAGLPADIVSHKWSEHPRDFREVLTYLNTQSTCFPVQEIKSCSNLGYALLGVRIQDISGIPYEEYIRQDILVPLGMDNSGLKCRLMEH
jgi:CubicO group peptidase (beta-lactamase class C family)